MPLHQNPPSGTLGVRPAGGGLPLQGPASTARPRGWPVPGCESGQVPGEGKAQEQQDTGTAEDVTRPPTPPRGGHRLCQVTDFLPVIN